MYILKRPRVQGIIFPKEIIWNAYRSLCTKMFFAVLVTLGKNWKQLEADTVSMVKVIMGNWIMNLYAAIKNWCL